MYQVGTGDGWSDIAREFKSGPDEHINPFTAVFFSIYVFVVGLVRG